MMHIDNKFEHGEIVYLITDPDQFERIVTRFVIGMNKTILYELSCGVQVSLHYDAEVSKKKDIATVMGIGKIAD